MSDGTDTNGNLERHSGMNDDEETEESTLTNRAVPHGDGVRIERSDGGMDSDALGSEGTDGLASGGVSSGYGDGEWSGNEDGAETAYDELSDIMADESTKGATDAWSELDDLERHSGMPGTDSDDEDGLASGAVPHGYGECNEGDVETDEEDTETE